MDTSLWLFSVSLVILFLGYPIYLSCLRILNSNRIQHSTSINQTNLPFISILIPTYNEGLFIHDKLENTLMLEYPKERTEILFIDGSSDGTKEIISEYAAKNSRIKLINQTERTGKPAALNLALKCTRGDIIVISDADSILRPNCIHLLVQRLEDPSCGLVGAFTEVKGKGHVTNLEQSYWELSNYMRLMEAQIDSPSSVIASCYAFKRALIPQYKEYILADDMWACIKIREQGFNADYLLEARAVDFGVADSIKNDFSHKVRKGIACLQVFSYFKHMLLNVKYGLFGTMILPSHLLRYVLCPYAFFILIGSGLFLAFSPYFVLEILIVTVTLAWGVILLNNITRYYKTSPSQYSIKGILQGLFMFIALQPALIVAQIIWLTGKYNVQWNKTR